MGAKICTDLKNRTKRKIAENQQRLSATGGSPLSFKAVTDMEKSIDSILVMSEAAAPITAPLLTEKPIVHSTPIINSPPRRLAEAERSIAESLREVTAIS
ncbi:unnamed protein product [Ceratitis capitata]|uniref:(Mediterranean fruit fly) hypothetical protein n=1 Tax=Ceratitis capitata TaxID=7213 RepID=A0A811US35_CERCA|nr:unnamed protein product [Ceratitis capitata]